MRYYGVAPMVWLGETPIAVIRAMLHMMPILQAEEALETATEVAVGSGTAGNDGPKAMRAWQRIADQREGKRARKATPAELARMGIRVVTPQKKKE